MKASCLRFLKPNTRFLEKLLGVIRNQDVGRKHFHNKSKWKNDSLDSQSPQQIKVMKESGEPQYDDNDDEPQQTPLSNPPDGKQQYGTQASYQLQMTMNPTLFMQIQRGEISFEQLQQKPPT